MLRTGLTILAAVAASCCICLTVSRATQPRTGVAVVDLDEVSRRVGKMTEMQKSMQDLASQAQQKLTAIEQNASAQLDEARKTLEAAPSTELTQKFQRMQQSAVVQLNQLKQRAELEVSGHRQQLVNKFREDARPVVASVAKKHGFSTVVTKNETFLFSFENSVDITDEVAEQMAKASPGAAPAKKTAPAAPATAKNAPWPASGKEQAQAAKEPAHAASQPIQQVKHETR